MGVSFCQAMPASALIGGFVVRRLPQPAAGTAAVDLINGVAQSALVISVPYL
jgi:hypothetical protein